MNERDYLAERFEEHRTHLRAVAYRMLGSVSEVDDSVQEAWLQLSRADATGIDNLGGWLTTVRHYAAATSKVCSPSSIPISWFARTCRSHPARRARSAARQSGRR